MATRGLYRGFSSFEFQNNKTFKLYDVELVKLDLLNHIFTKRGERVMMPTFGTTVPELVFEPLDEKTIDEVGSEILRVLNYDPRVDVLDFDVRPDYDTHTITVAARLLYIELSLVDDLELNIEFER